MGRALARANPFGKLTLCGQFAVCENPAAAKAARTVEEHPIGTTESHALTQSNLQTWSICETAPP
jgi:hypothetical protein